MLIKPLWYNKIVSFMTASSIQIIITAIIIPIYLCLLNYYLSKKHQIDYRLFFINALIIFFCIWFSSNLHFENWANSIGDKIKPDNETLEIIGLERSIGNILSFIGLIICFFKLKKNANFKTNEQKEN